MKTVATCLNILSIVAFVTGLVTALISLSHLEGDQGLVPVEMLLILTFWTLPALIVAVVAFVASMVVTARESAKQQRQALNDCADAPRGLGYTMGQACVALGVAYAVWSMAARLQTLLASAEVIAAGGEPVIMVFMAISVLAAAVPGLLICIVGYWMMRPAKDLGDTHPELA